MPLCPEHCIVNTAAALGIPNTSIKARRDLGTYASCLLCTSIGDECSMPLADSAACCGLRVQHAVSKQCSTLWVESAAWVALQCIARGICVAMLCLPIDSHVAEVHVLEVQHHFT